MYEEIVLEPEQKELLKALVEADRNVPREGRQKFMLSSSVGVHSHLLHPGLPGGTLPAYQGDLDSLADYALLRPSWGFQATPLYDVTPRGIRYHRHLKEEEGQPTERVEMHVTSYVAAEGFQAAHPAAYAKWAEAERLLWNTESRKQGTTVGHLCREALQKYADDLVRQCELADAVSDRSKTVARLRAVLEMKASGMGGTVKPFLDALLAYWGTVSDLIQRQEHGAQKEGDPLVWRDARRVVFHTALVMFEIHNTL